MPTIDLKIQRTINGVDIEVYEVDLNNPDQVEKLKGNLTTRIQKIKAHQDLSRFSTFTNVPNLKPEFISKVNAAISSSTDPIPHGRAWFDVRRARVTEFMAQLLLEKQFNCIFVDEADKRVNITPAELYSSTPGIDVPGIQNNGSGLKFVVCEVKASQSATIPSSSSSDLLDDINKSYNDERSRLSREILDYFMKLSGMNVDEELIKSITAFLIELLSESQTKERMLRNVIFFPFLIRNNSRILSDSNLDDFRDFKMENFQNTNLKGLIWLFNQDIDSFCNDLYTEAITQTHE